MKVNRVFLDRGHGLHNEAWSSVDPGATASGKTEAGMIGVIAKAVHALSNDGPDIVLTPEHSRSGVVQFVNDNAEKGDVLLVLHMNSSSNSKATGLEVIYSHMAPDARADQATRIAEFLAKQLGLKCRGAYPDALTPNGKHDGLLVLRETKCPAFLIELAFISNPLDRTAVEQKGRSALANLIVSLGQILEEK